MTPPCPHNRQHYSDPTSGTLARNLHASADTVLVRKMLSYGMEAAMVLWCKNCGAYLGLRPPVRNWKVERNRFVCASCSERSTASAASESNTEKMTSASKPNNEQATAS